MLEKMSRTVILKRPVSTGSLDEFNAETFEWTEDAVKDVLVVPENGSDVIENNRPDGVKILFTCYFPVDYAKNFTNDDPFEDNFTHSKIGIDGEFYEVIASAKNFNYSPNRWDRVVKAGKTNG